MWYENAIGFLYSGGLVWDGFATGILAIGCGVAVVLGGCLFDWIYGYIDDFERKPTFDDETKGVCFGGAFVIGLAIFCGALALKLILTFPVTASYLGGAAGVIFLARYARRLHKAFLKHTKDPKAHKVEGE